MIQLDQTIWVKKKQLQSEDGSGPGVFTLFKETRGDWTTESDTDIEFIHGIVGESSGKTSINEVADASTKTDQGSGQLAILSG